MASASANHPKVSLRGASELTASFLKCAINCILYNRQIFPKQSFAAAERFGCDVFVTKDEWLEKYLTKCLGQVQFCFNLHAHAYTCARFLINFRFPAV
jgi:hypothetical protein